MLWSIIQICAVIFTLAHTLRKVIERIFYKGVDITKEENIRNKIVIVSGANSGIGLQTAYEFAARDANVILACRDRTKAEKAIKWIRSKTNMGNINAMRLDLASLESVRNFAKDFKEKYDKLNILVNNGGLFLPGRKRDRTMDGFEMQMGVNHLGHFLLTNLLLEPLKKAAPSRIVHVSSVVHLFGKLDFEDFMSDTIVNPKYIFPIMIPVTVLYCRSKMAQVLFNHELAKRLQGTGVTTYCLSPGGVKTNAGQHSSWLEMLPANLFLLYFQQSLEQGVSTVLHCALNKDLANESGQMYQWCKIWDPAKRTAYTDEDTKKLWEISAKYVQL